ncbi:hypothetical protein GUH15_26620, partial [Xanthomonas citri pv. citri]|nr:hypothetical protein [Xanthomonas citri pv. citri]
MRLAAGIPAGAIIAAGIPAGAIIVAGIATGAIIVAGTAALDAGKVARKGVEQRL